MLQDLLRIPLPFKLPLVGSEIVIHGFGLMLVIGFLCAMGLARFMARRSRIDPELFSNAALIGLFSGVIGARMSHVLENYGYFMAHPREIFDIASGGLTYYGGFLLAFPILVLYARAKKVPIRIGMDIVAPCLMIGLAFGRIGCFLNGCCYGAECQLPWAVHFPYGSYAYQDQYDRDELSNIPDPLTVDTGHGEALLTREQIARGYTLAYNPADPDSPTHVPLPANVKQLAALQYSRPVHPAQLYSAFTAFLLAGLLYCYYTMPHTPGHVFALMMILEGVARYCLELVRAEPPVDRAHFGSMSLSMILGIAIALAGVAMWLAFSQVGGDSSTIVRTTGDDGGSDRGGAPVPA
jgi:phosphatidylglycerol:prolipoprotein diacylglycerol transferase